MPQTPEQRRLIRLAGAINAKARRLGAVGEVTANDLARLYLAQRSCRYCGISLDPGHYGFDHVVPFENGGSNTTDNLVPCCTICNREKFTKTPEELKIYRDLEVQCAVCHKTFRPRWGEWKAGRGRVCSRRCAARSRWMGGGSKSPASPRA